MNLSLVDSSPSRPILSRFLQESLHNQARCKLAAHVSALTASSPTNRIPRWTTSFYGLLGGNGVMTNIGTGQDEKGEEIDASVDIASLDQVKIIDEAIEAVEAISILMEESGNEWLSGAR